MRQKKQYMLSYLSIAVKMIVMTGIIYMVWLAAKLYIIEHYNIPVMMNVYGLSLYYYAYIIDVIVLIVAANISSYVFLSWPLKKCIHVIMRVKEGDLFARMPACNSDELTGLANAFNRMMQQFTDLSAHKIQADQDLFIAKEELKLKTSLEEKNTIIEQTNQKLADIVHNMSLLYEVGQEVSSVVDLDELYAQITNTLKRSFHTNKIMIAVLDDKDCHFHVKAAYGLMNENELLQQSFALGEGLTGLVAQSRRKIYVRDTDMDFRFNRDKHEVPDYSCSFLSIPLIVKDDVLGVINYLRESDNQFSKQDVKMLSLVANQVALAISNAKLYTKTRELSVKDELIGIHNRRYFNQMLQMEWKRAIRFKRELSLIILDVDHFKSYNDTFGHPQGDQALKQIGAIFKDNLREVDTIARIGGEEFVLLLPGTDQRGAIAAAEKVRLLVESSAFLTVNDEQTRPMTISAGISTYPLDADQMEDMVDHADIALYRAKENGRNQVECYQVIEIDPENIITSDAEDETEIAVLPSKRTPALH